MVTAVTWVIVVVLVAFIGVTVFDIQPIGDLERNGFQQNCGNFFSNRTDGLCGVQKSAQLFVVACATLTILVLISADYLRRRGRRRSGALSRNPRWPSRSGGDGG